MLRYFVSQIWISIICIVMNDTKICPLSADGIVYCIREECAWWAEWANACSVPTIAGILADSEICRNVFPTLEQPKEE